MNPRPGQVMTVFRSRLRPEGAEQHTEHAVRLSEPARSMPGAASYCEASSITVGEVARGHAWERPT